MNFQSVALLSIVAEINQDSNGKSIYTCKQYEIPNKNRSGWDQSELAINIDENGIVKIGINPITKVPEVVQFQETTEVDKNYYEKYIVPVCTVGGFGLAIGGLVVAVIAL